MKIHGKRLLQFQDLNIGDIFYDKDTRQFYIRIENQYDDGERNCNAISLDNGCALWFDDREYVCKYNKSLNLKYDWESADFIEWIDY